MKKVLLILLLNTSAWAACPLFTYGENHKLDAEINNLCDNILNPTINYETVTKAVFNNLSVSTITAVSSETVTNLTVTTKATVPNGSASTDAVAYGQLAAIQLAGNSSVTNFTTTANTFQTTNLSVTLTLGNAAHNVLIIACSTISIDVANKQAFLTLARGGSNILAASGQAVAGGTNPGAMSFPFCMTKVDTPGSVGPHTYAVQIKNTDGTTTIELPGGPQTQYMIAMESQ